MASSARAAPPPAERRRQSRAEIRWLLRGSQHAAPRPSPSDVGGCRWRSSSAPSVAVGSPSPRSLLAPILRATPPIFSISMRCATSKVSSAARRRRRRAVNGRSGALVVRGLTGNVRWCIAGVMCDVVRRIGTRCNGMGRRRTIYRRLSLRVYCASRAAHTQHESLLSCVRIVPVWAGGANTPSGPLDER